MEIKRTSTKTRGGDRISFTALVVVGDQKGRVGYALGKSKSVGPAIRKGMRKAKKETINLPLENNTIPYNTDVKFKSAKVVLKPGKPGTGLIAGGVIRKIAEVAGIRDLVAKNLGSNNKNMVVKAVFKAFRKFKNDKFI